MVSRGAFLSLGSILTYTLVAYVVGRLIVRRIGASSELAIAGAPLLGASALGLQLWMYGAFHIPWTGILLFLPWAAFAAVSRGELMDWVREAWQRGRQGVAALMQMDSLSIVFGLLIAVIGFSYLINLVLQPLSAWDALSDWLLKAKHFYTMQSVTLSGLSSLHADDPYSVVGGLHIADFQRHPDYPPLFPLIVASFYTLIGHVDDTVGKAVNFVFMVTAATACFTVVRQKAGARLALAFTFLMLALPKFLGALFDRYPSDYMGMADYALAIAIFLSLAHLAEIGSPRRTEHTAMALIFASIAALTKNEGLVFLAIVAGILVVHTVGHSRRKTLRIPPMRLLVPVAGAFVAVGSWQVYIKLQGFTSDLIANAHPLAILPQLPIRALTVVGFVLANHPFSLHGDYGWLTLAYVLCTALLIRNKFRNAALPFVAFNLQILSYLVVYLFTPLPLLYHLTTTYDRLVLELTPSLILLLAVSLAPFLRRAPATAIGRSYGTERPAAPPSASGKPAPELAGVT